MFRDLASSLEFLELDSKVDSTIANERNVSTIAIRTPFPQPHFKCALVMIVA
jgi:hypothetical protein